VKNARAGQVQYRTDKGGIVQCTIGRASFEPEQLKSNLLALIEALNKARPQGTKGIYLKKVSVSSTMGAACASTRRRSRKRRRPDTQRRPGIDIEARERTAAFEGASQRAEGSAGQRVRSEAEATSRQRPQGPC
jgi:hypothetical protein